ncbi:MAG: peptidylprolyl isomerase [Spirochaetales bacterium]|nr:peptidylprolyl isomerase [Spirochaetales bacterium]
MIRFVFITLVCLLFFFCCENDGRNLPPGLYADIETNRGTFTLRLDFDKLPMTVSNFVGLASGLFKDGGSIGRRFYENTVFYDVIDNLMVAGGDPYGDGRGGPGYTIPYESNPGVTHNVPYTISMVRCGNEVHGSGFAVYRVPAPWLDGLQPAFGRVIRGTETVDALQRGDYIKKATVIRIGSAANAFRVDDDMFEKLRGNVTNRIRDRKRSVMENQRLELERRLPGVAENPQGLADLIEREGEGEPPEEGDRLVIVYTVELPDGSVIMSSQSSTDYSIFITGDIIKGLKETIMQMKKGESRVIVVPPDYGFGGSGVPGLVPPDTFLIFRIELVDYDTQTASDGVSSSGGWVFTSPLGKAGEEAAPRAGSEQQ